MSTPCYYCELDRKEDCKWCIHSGFDPEIAIKQAKYDVLINAAEWVDDGFYETTLNAIANDLRKMAEKYI